MAASTMPSSDPRWLLMGFKSVDALMQKIDLPGLAPEVPEELAKRFSRIERSLRLVYYEYELVDVVLPYAVTTVEMALRIRYRLDHRTESGGSPKFSELIAWAKDIGLLQGEEKKIDFLRKFRNGLVHPHKDSFGGIVFLLVFRFAIELTNEVFQPFPGNNECHLD